jgi:hypothetical protein
MRSRLVPVRWARGSHSRRAISRSRRRTRCRATADRPKRGTITPTRAPSRPDAAAYKSTMFPWRRRPARRMRRMSRVRRTRAERGRRSPGSRDDGSSAAPALAVEIVTDRQTGASPTTPSRQDLPPRLGLHAGPEPVVLDPFPVRRFVICRLAHRASLSLQLTRGPMSESSQLV